MAVPLVIGVLAALATLASSLAPAAAQDQPSPASELEQCRAEGARLAGIVARQGARADRQEERANQQEERANRLEEMLRTHGAQYQALEGRAGGDAQRASQEAQRANQCVAERDGIRNDAEALRRESADLRAQLVRLQQEQAAGAERELMSAFPCAAIALDEPGRDPRRLRAIVRGAPDAAALRSRGGTMSGLQVQIETLANAVNACLRRAGDVVHAAESSGSGSEIRIEQVYDSASAPLFRQLQPRLIEFEDCADAAQRLRESGVLGELANSDLSIWALRNRQLGLCREARDQPLDRVWQWQGGNVSDRSGILVFQFDPQGG